MLKRQFLVRYLSYSLGTLFTVINLLLITYYLNIFQFAVWGVANSLIYIFSQLSQLTYVQYVEKYFPNLTKDEMNNYLYKFLKTVFILTPFWFGVLSLLNYLEYFEKYNADNLFILFLIISITAIVEASIEIVSKYFLALNKTQIFDLNELIIFKLLRLGVFYLLLVNLYSVYYLLLANLILRFFLLVRVLNLDKIGVFKIASNIINAKIFVDNFNKLNYTIIAFLTKTCQVTFLNVIFIILTINSSNLEIAKYSLAILIINNSKNVVASLSSLLSPLISKNIKKKIDNSKLIGFVLLINSILISVLTLGVYFITEYRFVISIFLTQFDADIYPIILLAFFSSTIITLYLPAFFNIMFSDNEKKLFLIISTNFILCSFIFYFLNLNFSFSLIYMYIIFEAIIFLFTRFYFNLLRDQEKLFTFSLSFIAVVILIVLKFLGVSLSVVYFAPFFVVTFYFDLRNINNLYKDFQNV